MRSAASLAGSPRVRVSIASISLLCVAGCGAVQSRPTMVPDLPPRSIATPPQPPLGPGILGANLFVEPDDGKRLLTRPIRKAARSIDLTMYLLTDHTLIHDLEYAAANGVRVRAILEQKPFGDGAAGIGANQSAFDQLYAADIPVHWSSGRFRLTHEKTMIVDSDTAYILTMNYTRSAFTKNREFGLIDAEPADVREASAIFAADWRDVPYTPRDPNLLLSPVNSRGRLLALLARAHHTLDLYAEEVQDRQLEAALVACARRGVRVRLITNTGDPASAPGVATLRSGGVGVRQLSAPYIHAKAVIADGRWAFVGSENISAASLDQNRELGALVANSDAIARLDATFAQDWAS